MKRKVSRLTDALPCTKCGDEPRRPGQRWGNHCFAEYNRHQREMEALYKAAGYVKMKLSPMEWELVKIVRRATAEQKEVILEALRTGVSTPEQEQLLRDLFPRPTGRHHLDAA